MVKLKVSTKINVKNINKGKVITIIIILFIFFYGLYSILSLSINPDKTTETSGITVDSSKYNSQAKTSKAQPVNFSALEDENNKIITDSYTSLVTALLPVMLIGWFLFAILIRFTGD